MAIAMIHAINAQYTRLTKHTNIHTPLEATYFDELR